jgi:hypothetical protein
VIDSYLLKLIDNTSLVDLYDTPFGGGCRTKVEEILSNFTKRCRKILNKIDLEDNYCDCKKHKSKSQEKLLEPVIEMMETLAGAMLKTIEKKEEPFQPESDTKSDEYTFEQNHKGLKIKKAEKPNQWDQDFGLLRRKSSYRKELKNLIKEAKLSLELIKKNKKYPSPSSKECVKSDKKHIKKNLKKWKKELKKYSK